MGTQAAPSQISPFASTVKRWERYVNQISRVFSWIAGAGLVAMLLLVVGDIVGIKLLAQPVPGGIEIVAFLGVVVIGFAIAWTQVVHGHIQVDIIIMKLPPRARAVVDIVISLLGVVFFVILAWRTWDYGQVMLSTGEVSMTKRIPFYPFIWALAACYLVTVLVLIIELLKAILKVGNKWTQ
jgi:TRAP-type C4-dicarboxylate transport system permease small subunit